MMTLNSPIFWEAGDQTNPALNRHRGIARAFNDTDVDYVTPGAQVSQNPAVGQQPYATPRFYVGRNFPGPGVPNSGYRERYNC